MGTPSSLKKRLVIAGGIAIVVGGIATYSLTSRDSSRGQGGSGSQDPHATAEETSLAVSDEAREPSGRLSLDREADSKPSNVAALPAVDAGKEAVALAPAQPEAQIEKEPDSCFTASYQREKETKEFLDNEEWTLQRNLIQLKHELSSITQKTVCVRVNGTPVKHEWTKKGVVIGPLAGPGAKITVRYCLGKEQCSEECKIPKDDFMAALGSDDEQLAKRKGAKGKAGRWSAGADGADVTESVEAEMARELADQADLVLYSGWLEKSERPACDRRTAGTQVASGKK